MKVLFTSHFLEFPAHGGPELRITNTIKALSDVSDLFIINQITDSSKYNLLSTQTFCEKYSHKYLTVNKKQPKNNILKILYKILLKIFSIEPNNVSKEIIEFVKDNNIDIIWFGYGNISYPLIKSIRKSLPRIKIVCDTDSVWSRFISRSIPFSKGLRKLKIRLDAFVKANEERWLVKICDITTAVSEVDAEYYRSISKDQNRIKIFSNVIDLCEYKKTTPPDNFKKPSVFLAGSFGSHSAMNTAASWLLDEVMPKVFDQIPDMHLYIVGKASDLEFGNRQNDNVTVTGRVESVLPYLCNVNASLVPLNFESGTRFKILEAAACKTPVISTTLGAEGIPARNNYEILIADTSEEFAQAIIKVINDKNLIESLKENCYKLVQRSYCIESLSTEAEHILRILNND